MDGGTGHWRFFSGSRVNGPGASYHDYLLRAWKLIHRSRRGFGILTEKGTKQIYLCLHTLCIQVSFGLHTMGGGGRVMCEGGHAALAGWPSLEFGVWRTKAKGPRPIGRPMCGGCCCWWSGSHTSPGRQELHHVGCHVMVVAARGESLSDPRKERVRFHPVPRFWGTYWL